MKTFFKILAPVCLTAVFVLSCNKQDDPVQEQDSINGHKYVEMGDGLKWATMNVGATKPEDYGDYYAWGETSPGTDYTWETYKWMQSGQDYEDYITKYTIADGDVVAIWYDGGNFIGDNKTVLEISDDAARAQWGGSWRMPTGAEWEALTNTAHFTWAWTDDYNGTGVAGCTVTSKVSGYEGNRIFLPAAGNRYKTELLFVRYGFYWSSSLYARSSSIAYVLSLTSDKWETSSMSRFNGISVRPVSE